MLNEDSLLRLSLFKMYERCIHLSVGAMSTQCWALCFCGMFTKYYKLLIYIGLNSPSLVSWTNKHFFSNLFPLALF